MANTVVERYLRGEAGDFFPSHPRSASDRKKAVEQAFRPLAPDVAAALERQNARLAPSPARDRHLAALREGAAAVVTGQQVGLFLGPLYTIYKAASAVRLAKQLAAESGRPVVPVFWLQVEDHDLPEIAAIHVATAHGDPVELKLPSSADDRVSIAHCTLPSSIADALATLRETLGDHETAAAHVTRLERHYRAGATWGEAFAGVLSELFAEEGLVFVDPRDPALGAAAAPIHRRAIAECEHLSDVLLARVAALERAGGAAPVHVRPGAPLSFLHPGGVEGPRHRLEKRGNCFGEVGGAGLHTRSELLQRLDANPLQFSTSALLRPLVQDTLLPTAAYVGGPGELAYFAQLAPLYEAFAIAMPLIVARARFVVVEERPRRQLNWLGLTSADVARPMEQLLAQCSQADAHHPTPDDIQRRMQAGFEAVLKEVSASLGDLAPAMAAEEAKTRETLAWTTGRFANGYGRLRLQSDRGLVDALERLKRHLQPNEAPQERVFALAQFTRRLSDRAFVERVLASIDPLNPALKELRP